MEQLRGFLDDHAEKLLRRYRSGAYSGYWFDCLEPRGDDPETANEFTAVDLVAVTTLAVRVPGWAAVDMLDRSRRERRHSYDELLAEIPTDTPLYEATDEVIDDGSAWERLRVALRSYHGIGPVTASKLIARKRPHLAPVRDQHVMRGLFGRDDVDQVQPLRDALRSDPELVERVDQVRTLAGCPDLSLLRVCDVVIWMRQCGLDDPRPRSHEDPEWLPPPQRSGS